MSLINISDLRVGDVGLGPIGGAAGWIPKLGQLLVDGRSWPEHAFIVTTIGETGRAVGLVQAMPRGAEMVKLVPELHFTADHVFYRPPYGVAPGYSLDPGVCTKLGYASAVECATQLIGTPYGFLDYASIALWHWRVRPGWVANYIRSTRHMICSQLVDECLRVAGIHLFNDGRLPQDVTPAALAKQMNLLGWDAMYPKPTS